MNQASNSFTEALQKTVAAPWFNLAKNYINSAIAKTVRDGEFATIVNIANLQEEDKFNDTEIAGICEYYRSEGYKVSINRGLITISFGFNDLKS